MIFFVFIFILIPCLSAQEGAVLEALARDMLNGKRIKLVHLSPENRVALSKMLVSMLNGDSIQVANMHYWRLTSRKDIAALEHRIDACFFYCEELLPFLGAEIEPEIEREARCEACWFRRRNYFSQYYLSHNMAIFYLIEAIRLSNYEFENEIDIVSVRTDSLGSAYYMPVEKDSSFFRELGGYYRRYFDTVSVSTYALSAKSCEASPLYPSAYRWYSPKVAAAVEVQARSLVSRISKDLPARNMRSIELAGASPFYIISKYGLRDMPLYFGLPCF